MDIHSRLVPTENRARKMNLMLRLSDEERALLEALAVATGLTKADVLRQAMRAEAKRRGVNVVAKKSRRRAP